MKLFKIGEVFDRPRFLLRSKKRFGELLDEKIRRSRGAIIPAKSTFSEDHISGPRGCCAPKFLHALGNGQVLLAHTPPETGVSLQFFFKGGQKLAQNVAYATYNFGGKGRSLMKLCYVTCC